MRCKYLRKRATLSFYTKVDAVAGHPDLPFSRLSQLLWGLMDNTEPLWWEPLAEESDLPQGHALSLGVAPVQRWSRWGWKGFLLSPLLGHSSEPSVLCPVLLPSRPNRGSSEKVFPVNFPRELDLKPIPRMSGPNNITPPKSTTKILRIMKRSIKMTSRPIQDQCQNSVAFLPSAKTMRK